MDPNTGINQDPLADNNGATAFSPDIDMTAINEAVEAEKNVSTVQTSYDVNDISLENTPTTDTDLQKQLADNPNMSLANSQDMTSAPTDPVMASPNSEVPVADPVAASEAVQIDEPTPDPSVSQEAAELAAERAATIESIPVETSVRATNPVDQAPVAPNDAESQAALDPYVTPAPDARPPEGAETAKIDPATNLAKSKSKLPSYILIGLSIIAVVSVIIAVIVSIG